MNTLLLNADFRPMQIAPLSIIPWQSSIRAYFTDSMYIFKTYDDLIVHSPSIELAVPSIVVSSAYRKKEKLAKFSRGNIYLRDRYTCQYCNVRFYYNELTLDHVYPKSLGGPTSWDNLVTSCKSCNSDKADRTDVTPISSPFHPTWYQVYNQSKCYKLSIPDPAWQEFLDWPEELLEIKSVVNL